MKQGGFSYLELAISFTVMVIFYIAFMALFSKVTAQDAYQTSQDKLSKIRVALDEYAAKNGFLPCPASLSVLESNSAFGTSTDCTAAATSGVFDSNTGTNTVRVGALPFRSLNLPPSFTYDSWNNRIVYGVVKTLAVSASSFMSNTPSAAFTIRDQNGNTIASSTNTAYVLVSLGKDSNGAYSPQGQVKLACATSLIETENCNYDNIFVTGLFNDGNTTNKYDDLFVMKTRAQIIKDNKLAVSP